MRERERENVTGGGEKFSCPNEQKITKKREGKKKKKKQVTRRRNAQTTTNPCPGTRSLKTKNILIHFVTLLYNPSLHFMINPAYIKNRTHLTHTRK